MTQKLTNWVHALHEQIEAYKTQPFAWGKHDCCTLAADCVQAMTGVDKMANYRGGYKTAAGAARKLAKAGGMEAAISAELGDSIAPALAQRGDVVCFSSPLGDACGVCVGGDIRRDEAVQ